MSYSRRFDPSRPGRPALATNCLTSDLSMRALRMLPRTCRSFWYSGSGISSDVHWEGKESQASPRDIACCIWQCIIMCNAELYSSPSSTPTIWLCAKTCRCRVIEGIEEHQVSRLDVVVIIYHANKSQAFPSSQWLSWLSRLSLRRSKDLAV